MYHASKLSKNKYIQYKKIKKRALKNIFWYAVKKKKGKVKIFVGTKKSF